MMLELRYGTQVSNRARNDKSLPNKKHFILVLYKVECNILNVHVFLFQLFQCFLHFCYIDH